MPSLTNSKRGAALILEIIIYLVIVALIAIAVTSGVRAIRDLAFASHARGDIKVMQTWLEGKYAQDGQYPVGDWNYRIADAPRLTPTYGGNVNVARFNSQNGANSGYCIALYSDAISDANKVWFWLSSANPSQIMQGGTATANGGSSWGPKPPSGIAGLACP